MDRNELLQWISSTGTESFSRSGGPGGQNVNKVNTKVTLKLPLGSIPYLSDDEISNLQERLRNRINGDGELVIQASEARTQAENRSIAAARAADLIIAALKREKKRKPTRPGRGANERRIRRKKKRKEIKRNRKPPTAE